MPAAASSTTDKAHKQHNQCSWKLSCTGCINYTADPEECGAVNCTNLLHHNCSSSWELAQYQKEDPGGDVALNPYESTLKRCIHHHPFSKVALAVDSTSANDGATSKRVAKLGGTTAVITVAARYNDWWSEILELQKKDLVILNLIHMINPKTKQAYAMGEAVQCRLCRDGEGTSNGVITLRYPFDPYYWTQHCLGQKHIRQVAFNEEKEKLIGSGKKKRQKQRGISAFIAFKGKGKKHPKIAGKADGEKTNSKEVQEKSEEKSEERGVSR